MNTEWESITKEELAELAKELPNSVIAEKYGVTVGQVRYKRKKFGITMYDMAFQHVLEKKNMQKIKNAISARDQLINRDNIDSLAKAITQYAFRSGPVEQIHIEGKLTDKDMKTLNKYMVNRIAGLLQKAFDGEWEEMTNVFAFYVKLCDGWDKAVPDTKDFNIEFD